MKEQLPLTVDDSKDKVRRRKNFWSPRRAKIAVSLIAVLTVFSCCISRGLVMHFKERVLDGAIAALESRGLWEPIYGFQTDGYHKTYPGLEKLENSFPVIRQEVDSLLANDDIFLAKVPLTHNVLGHKRKVMDLKWRFLALKIGTFLPENEAVAPRTAAVLRQIPGIDQAFFSIMEPHTYIPPHWGPWVGYLRYQLPILVPSNNADKKCYIQSQPGLRKTPERSDKINHHDYSIMEGSVKHFWKEGQGFLFDDTFVHDVRNDSDGIRVVLFIDQRRHLPWYLNVLNKIILWFAMKTPHISRMREKARFSESEYS